MLSKIFGSKREETIVGYRNLHNEELHDLSSAQAISKVIKSRRISWMGRVSHKS